MEMCTFGIVNHRYWISILVNDVQNTGTKMYWINCILHTFCVIPNNFCHNFLQQLIKSFEVCDLPVRAARFVARKNWIVTGSVSIFAWQFVIKKTLWKWGKNVFTYLPKIVKFYDNVYNSSQDDMHVRVYNYNTLERVHQFEAHSDYLRAIAVHPTQPYILTSSGKI